MIRNDSTIDEIRKIRHQISQRFNNDPKKVIEYYIQLQKKYRNRLINLAEMTEKDVPEKLTQV